MSTRPKTHDRRFVVRPQLDLYKLVPREWIARGTVLLLQEADRLLEAFPAQVAPLIVAEPDPSKRRAILNREVRRMVRKLNAAHEALLDKLGSTEH